MTDPRALAEAWEATKAHASRLHMTVRRVPGAAHLVVWNCGDCRCPLLEGASDLLWLARCPIPCLAKDPERMGHAELAAMGLAHRTPKGGLAHA